MTREAANVPDAPPQLLPERSAWAWIRIGLVSLAATLPMLLLIVIGAALPHPIRDIVMSGSLFVIFGLCTIGGRAGMKSNGAYLRERDAGYTTLYGMHRELWQLHHSTGEVLRRPGERVVRRRPRDQA
jgi:hypothetical protein